MTNGREPARKIYSGSAEYPTMERHTSESPTSLPEHMADPTEDEGGLDRTSPCFLSGCAASTKRGR